MILIYTKIWEPPHYVVKYSVGENISYLVGTQIWTDMNEQAEDKWHWRLPSKILKSLQCWNVKYIPRPNPQSAMITEVLQIHSKIQQHNFLHLQES